MKAALKRTVRYYCILSGIVRLDGGSVFILHLIMGKLKIIRIVKGND
ncbi:hypothetical protein [Chitinophaga rhizosphaerae]|nr:hypothetical protein [Chitinophaga rhizosphaerae]